MSDLELIQPDGWPRGNGYSHGVVASGKIIAVAGQVGWDPATREFDHSFVAQVRGALTNIVTVLRAGGAEAKHVVRLTWYITDRDEYMSNAKAIGEVYREIFGNHYPAMSVVIVAGLIEPAAKVEIEATAVVP